MDVIFNPMSTILFDECFNYQACNSCCITEFENTQNLVDIKGYVQPCDCAILVMVLTITYIISQRTKLTNEA